LELGEKMMFALDAILGLFPIVEHVIKYIKKVEINKIKIILSNQYKDTNNIIRNIIFKKKERYLHLLIYK